MRFAATPPAPSTPPGSAAGAAWTAALARLDLGAPRARYILRSILAAWLALTVAYLLELDTPYSAASTVLLVINPVQGAVIGKGAWRLIGTLGGMAAATALLAAFAQMPWLFVLGFSAWLGLCVAGMTLLRHFRASGTVVAGYTVGLATFGALRHPELGFAHIVGRGSTVAVGVVCLGLVSALLSRRGTQARLEGMLTRLAAATAQALSTQHRAAADPARRALMAEVYGVDDLLALGKAESEDLAQRAAGVRHAMAALFAALAGGPAQAPPRLQAELEDTWGKAAQALAGSPRGAGAALHILDGARPRLAAVAEQASADATALIAAERLIEQIEDYRAALAGIEALRHPRPPGSRPRVHFHRDFAAAARNGLRAMLTLLLGGAFWIVSGWTQGDMMLLVLAPYCALLATSGDPAAGAVQFIKGTVAAVPMAFVCAFGVLPQLDGLPLLLAALALFWLPGIYATSTPRHGLAGLAYLVGFNTLTAAGNPMHYDLGLFLNWSAAWILATLFTLLGFRLLLPRVPARDLERLRRRIRDEGLALLRGARAGHGTWTQRQQHRIAQLGALLKSQPAAIDSALGDALASLRLGRELLRLRRWLAHAPADSPLRPPVAAALRGMSRRAAMPLRAASHARRAARRLLTPRSAGTPEQRRLGAALADIAALLQRHAGYWSTTSGSSRHAQ